MNLSCYFLIFILGFDCTEVTCNSNIVVLFEHDLDSVTEKSSTCSEDSLHKIELSYSGEKKYEFMLESSPNAIFFNYNKQKQYGILPAPMTNEILKILKEEKNTISFIAFEFTFNNPSKKEKRSYKVYKTGRRYEEVFLTDCVYYFHIEHLLRSFMNEKLLNVENFRSDNNRNILLQSANFNLQFFKSYSDCHKSLCEFLDFFNCFNLVNDGDKKSTTSSNSNDRLENTITVSELKAKSRKNLESSLINYFKQDFEPFYFYESDDPGCMMYMRMFEHLENRLKSRNLFLPILNETGTLEDYSQEFHYFIFEITKKYMKKHRLSNKKEISKKENLLKDLDEFLDDFEKEKIDLLLKDKFELITRKYFKRRINWNYEYISFNLHKIEKMICDFYNMIECITNKIKGHDITYIEPIVFEKFNCRLVKVLEIDVSALVKIKQIKRCGEFERKVVLEDDDFLFHSGKIYIACKKISEKRLKVLEISSAVNDLIIRIGVEKYVEYPSEFMYKDEEVLDFRYHRMRGCVIS